jgi:limonene 1,2-monooxygenase
MHGIGLLSIGATTAAGFDVLALHWDVMEERAAHYGTNGRSQQVAAGGPHALRRDPEQAYRDVEYGIEQWFDYFQHTAAFPQMAVGDGTSVREFIDFVNETGLGTVGTPEDAVEPRSTASGSSRVGSGAT